MLQLGIRGLGIARFKFNPISWFLKGEPGAWYDPSDFQPNWRRNLLTWSEDFANAAWQKIGSGSALAPTITANYATAPDGKTTASRAQFSLNGFTTSADISRLQQGVPTVVGQSETLTFYVKSTDGVSSYNMLMSSPDATNQAITVTGTWTRLPFSGITITTLLNCGFLLRGNQSPTHPNTADILIWHPQLELGSSASTYQKITDGIQDYYTVQPQPVLFQDSAGTIPVTAVEQPVGLMLDKSKGLALGAELVTNGDFATDTGWTKDTGWTISSGTANASSVGIGTGVYQPIAGAINTWYRITVTVSNYVSGSIAVTLFSGDNGPLISANGVYAYYLQKRTLSPNYAGAACFSSAFTGSVDNISVKQIAGNHAFQGDLTTGAAAKRPMLSARVNLLTKTEDFSDASWLRGTGVNVATTSVAAPNGTLTVSKYYLSNLSTGGPTSQLSKGPFTATANMTFSCYVKSAGATGFFVIQDGAGNGSTLNLSTWQISSNISNGIGTVIPLPDGWYKFIITTTSTNPYFYSYFSSYTGDGTSGVYIWGADLRPTNSGALLPAYQRVNTASDYDTVGFPLYLKANGSSSAMSTNSIDFTATDKMTVVTGVRKLSDATIGIALELSAIADSNNGTFLLAPSFNGLVAAGAYYSAGAKGTSIARVTSGATYVAPISNINTFIDSISTPYAELKINGTQVSTNTAGQGTGNFGNYPLYLFARAGTSLFLNGQFYGAIIRGAQSDTASVTQTENYMAQKTGITF